MATIIKRLFGPLQVSNSATTRYTVPASTKARIRHVHIQNPSGSAVTFTMSIGSDAAATRLYDAFSVAANSIRDDFMDQALEPAEILQTNAGTNNVLVVSVSGEERPIG